MATFEEVKVLVTGFGVNHYQQCLRKRFFNRVQAFQDITRNPSWEIVSRLPEEIPGVRIAIHPESLKAAYHSLYEIVPKLVQSYQPDVVLHVGLAVERDYFAIERSAGRDGYQQNLDMDKKVFTKAESRTSWGKKSADRLETALDLDAVLEAWRDQLRSTIKENSKKGKGNGPTADVRLSDDVGKYVCGFIYYATLAELARRSDCKGTALFFHVPPLETEMELENGKKVLEALIGALASVWRTQIQ